MDKQTDPVIVDLLKWLKDNLPPDINEDDLFRKVRRVQKVFDTLIGLSFEEFYNYAQSLHQTPKLEGYESADEQKMLENDVNDKLSEIREYLNLNHEKQMKTKKLNASRSKLDLKKEQYQLRTSIRLNGCLELISRYNHLISKK